MRRRDHPRIGAEDLRPADPLELALLQHAEDLGLGGQGQLAHLVEEDRPARGALEPAGLLAIRPGEGAPLVAEELALDEALGQRSAVDPDERALGAIRVAMQRRGDQLLARAALADDQDGRIGRGRPADRLEDLAHRGALADERRLVVRALVGRGTRVAAGLRPQRADFLGQGALPQRSLQGQHDLVEIERLGEVVIGSPAHRLDGGGRPAQGGDDDDRQVGQLRAQLRQDLHAVAAGHLEVEQDGVRRLLGDLGQRLSAVGRLQGLIALGSQEEHEIAPDGPVVVGHQDLDWCVHDRCAPLFRPSATGRVKVNSAPV
jgi:hypothetical protein